MATLDGIEEARVIHSTLTMMYLCIPEHWDMHAVTEYLQRTNTAPDENTRLKFEWQCKCSCGDKPGLHVRLSLLPRWDLGPIQPLVEQLYASEDFSPRYN